MAIKLPSNILVGGRFPLDDKYWVNDYANLNDGEIYPGLHRWIKSGQFKDKEYVLLSTGIWKEVSGGEKGLSGTVKVGSVTTGAVPKITNVGTESAAILDFILPAGPKGDAPIIDIGQVVTVSGNESPSVSNVGTADRAILNFVLPKGTAGIDGINGQSVWMCFADDANGTNPDFAPNGKRFVSFRQAIQQPTTTQFTVWTKIQGTDGINGKSAYDLWKDAGNAGTVQDFLASLKGANGTDGAQGKSTWVAFASDGTGTGASFTSDNTKTHLSFVQAVAQPNIGSFTNWIKFVGNDGASGTDPDLLSVTGDVTFNASDYATISANAVNNSKLDQATRDLLASIANKVDKRAGYDLSKNDYTDTDKTAVSTISNKVDKIPGKGLSTEDFTTPLKTKLEGLPVNPVRTINNQAPDVNGNYDISVTNGYTDDQAKAAVGVALSHNDHTRISFSYNNTTKKITAVVSGSDLVIAQNTGQSTTSVMSQKAVTDSFALIGHTHTEYALTNHTHSMSQVVNLETTLGSLANLYTVDKSSLVNAINEIKGIELYSAQTGTKVDLGFRYQDRAPQTGNILINSLTNVRLGAKSIIRMQSLNTIKNTLPQRGTINQNAYNITFADNPSLNAYNQVLIDGEFNVIASNGGAGFYTLINPRAQLSTTNAVVELFIPDTISGIINYDSNVTGANFDAFISTTSVEATVTTPIRIEQRGFSYFPGSIFDIELEVIRMSPTITLAVRILPGAKTIL